MKLDFSADKGRHVGVVEKRHLKFEDGSNVYQTPASGRGLGDRNSIPIMEPRTTTNSKPLNPGIKTTTTSTKPEVDVSNV